MKEIAFGSSRSRVLVYAAVLGIILEHTKEMIDVAVTGNLTVNLDSASKPSPGDVLVVKILSDASIRTITWGTNITALALVTVASKTHVISFIYDEATAAYIATSGNIKID